MSKTIKRFVDDCKRRKKHSDFILSLSAGRVTSDGIVTGQQRGAEDTFSLGMPIYDEAGSFLGKLELGLFDNLNYSSKTKEGLDIPVEKWMIHGYSGESKKLKTYWQVRAGLIDVGEK